MPDVVTPLLFVYGTLKPSAQTVLGRTERDRLLAASRSLGPARMAGRLYDLGPYPAMVVSETPDEVVQGDVLQLGDAPSVFRWLDPYEGIDPAHPEAGEYLRLVRSARLLDGEDVRAWVYVYRAPPADGRLVVDGVWEPR